MRAFRFLHAADLHLDSPFRGLSELSEPLRDRVKAATFDALERLVDIAVQERVDFVVISGDVYDVKDRSLRAQLRFQQALQTLAGYSIPAFVIHGNHDPFRDGYRAQLRWPDSVRIFGCDAVESEVLKDEAGEPLARISGISFGQAAVTENLATGFQRWDDGLYHIALLHTNVDGISGHDNYVPCSTRDLIGCGVDYWALGHVHTRRVINERPWIVYPGNTQGRHVRETGAKGCYLVDVTEAGETIMAFHALDAVRWQYKELSISELETEQQLKEALEEEVENAREEAEGRPVLLRLALIGRGVLHAALRRNNFISELTSQLRESERLGAYESTVWIEEITDESGAPLDRLELAAKPGFVGDMLRIVEETGAETERLRGFADDVLSSLSLHPQLTKLLEGVSEEELLQWLREAEELALDALAGSSRAGWES